MKHRILAIMALFSALLLILQSCGEDKNPVGPNLPAPEISNISPDSTIVNGMVKIYGKNFGNTRDTNAVFFQSAIANTDYYFSSWNDTLIKVFVPETAKTGNIYVSVYGKTSNSVLLTIIEKAKPDPKIISIQPDSGMVGATVNIFGESFGKSRGDSKVEFCGIELKSDSDFPVWTDSKITTLVPLGAVTGKVFVYVNGKETNDVDFRIIKSPDQPKITKLSSLKGKIGEEIEITGEFFGDTKGSNYATFNNTKALTYTLWSNTKIKLEVPVGATSGELYVVVNGIQSNRVNFTVEQNEDPEAPFIEYLDNNLLVPGQNIGINGMNFGNSRGAGYVKLGDLKATTYTSWTDKKIIVQVPNNATDGSIVVYANNGKASNGKPYTIQKQNYLVEEVNIPVGNFVMGSNSGDYDEKPEHTVNITVPFKMSKYEITQEIWSKVMSGSNPSHPTELGLQKPVNQVTFIRAVEFCNRLSEMTKLEKCYTIDGDDKITCNFSKNGFRLPTEAEWEYAARAGKKNSDFNEQMIKNMGWTAENAEKHTKDVGMKVANDWGLYDIFGNVFEWCWDYWDSEYYANSPANDPRGPATGFGDRIARGGSYINGAATAFPWVRTEYPGTNDNYFSYVGFRVVRNNK